MEATPNNNTLPLRQADFSNLAEALDYAAAGVTGCNFYNGRSQLDAVLTYAQLRTQARGLARRLVGMGLTRGSRIAIIADTTPEFLLFFFACQYTGLVPVPLPVSVNLGNHASYVRQLRRLLTSCRASVLTAPQAFAAVISETAQDLDLVFVGDLHAFNEQFPETDKPLRPTQTDELAYIQYTSGSTRFPRGVMISQTAVMNNLAGIVRHGVKIKPNDRAMSWLPYYHDMGLVGLVLATVASQVSVDYMGTREFAMRPRQWLALMSRNKASVSFSPPFGYELCARRLRPGEADNLDLSAWRVAGVGAETIRPEPLRRFAQILEPSGFDQRAFLACYGMAECSLAVSFSPLNQGLAVDTVDSAHLCYDQLAIPVRATPKRETLRRENSYVDCGTPLPDFQVEIRNDNGKALSQRSLGIVHVKGPSVMAGYFGDSQTTTETLSADGWLNTGDLGYCIGDRLFITGRQKDLIIINGRNVWPQDLEYLAEQQPEVRPGDAIAFAAPDLEGKDTTILLVQCRETSPTKRDDLVARLSVLVREEIGIECIVELAPLHTLPRTSSGKLSRSKARLNYLQSQSQTETPTKHPAIDLSAHVHAERVVS